MPIGFITDADDMVTCAIARAFRARGQMRSPGGIADKETEGGMGVSADIEVKLFAAGAVTHGGDAGVEGLLVGRIDPGFDGEGSVAAVGRAKIEIRRDITGVAVVNGGKAKLHRGIR